MEDEEKKFFCVWNRFIRHDPSGGTGLSDQKTTEKCLEFVRKHISELKDLRLQLLQHLMTMWGHLRIPNDAIHLCMVEYDSLISKVA